MYEFTSEKCKLMLKAGEKNLGKPVHVKGRVQAVIDHNIHPNCWKIDCLYLYAFYLTTPTVAHTTQRRMMNNELERICK
jgi:hypothetical protein